MQRADALTLRVLKTLNEAQARWYVARETLTRGRGGRKRVADADPGFERALERIMAENTAGDPMSLLRWTNKSTGSIAEELTQLGHPTSDETVRRKLIDMEYSLQANRKSLEGTSPQERDEQFRYINRLVKQCLR